MRAPLALGPFSLDLDGRTLQRGGEPVPLGGRALDLLCALAEANGELVTKDVLMDRVWPGLLVEENNIQAQVSALRRALRDGDAAECLITVPGRGYRLNLASAGKKKPAIRGNLPQPSDPLIGRASDLETLAPLLRSRRVVTLVGPGGMGKSRLALQLGTDVQSDFPDGVWLVELAPLTRPELLAETVAALFNVSPQGDVLATRAISEYLGRRRLLLVLDNCEHVIAAAAEFAHAIIRACPEIVILATSREPLAIPGEYRYETPQLGLPETDNVTAARARQHSAIELFVARAAARGGFVLSDREAPIVAEICRRLDGMPFAIELAAARTSFLSPLELLARLDDSLRLLTSGGRTAAARQRTLRALIDWSHDLLSDAERAVLRRLSVFAGSFSLEMASHVVTGPLVGPSDVVEVLARLIDKSLVARVPGTNPTRYRLLETTRAFAADRLIECGETGWPRRLCEYLINIFTNAEMSWPTTATSTWLSKLEPELDNLRVSLSWSFGPSGDPTLGLILLGRTHWFWCELPLLREQRRWFELAKQCVTSETPAPVLARIHLALGWDPYFGDRSRLPDARKAELLFRLANEPIMLAQALGHAGRAASRYRDATEALAYFNEALALIEPLGPNKLQALLLLSLATSQKHAGNVVAARSNAIAGQAMAADLGDVQTRDMCGVQLASIAFEAGDLKEAIAIARDSLEKCRRSPFLRNHFVAVQWLAGFLLLNGELDTGHATAFEAFALSRVLGNVNLLDSLDQIALVALRTGNPAIAARLRGYADAYASRFQISRYGLSFALRDMLARQLTETVPEEEQRRLMAEGAAWHEDKISTVVATIDGRIEDTIQRAVDA